MVCVHIEPVRVSIIGRVPSDPTAMHDVADGHDTELRPRSEPVPVTATASVVGVQVEPESVSAKKEVSEGPNDPVPTEAMPTAVQFVADTHEIESSLALVASAGRGKMSRVHCPPRRKSAYTP
jgi:hypothetical protein